MTEYQSQRRDEVKATRRRFLDNLKETYGIPLDNSGISKRDVLMLTYHAAAAEYFEEFSIDEK